MARRDQEQVVEGSPGGQVVRQRRGEEQRRHLREHRRHIRSDQRGHSRCHSVLDLRVLLLQVLPGRLREVHGQARGEAKALRREEVQEAQAGGENYRSL